MLHLNGTSCVAIRRFQLDLFVIKGGSLMRRILLAQSKAEAAVGAGCWVHQMSRWEAAIRHCDNDKSQQPQRQLCSPFLSPSPHDQLSK